MKHFLSRLWLLCAALPLLAGTVPLTYNAVSDMVVRPKPAPPALGPAGSISHDPTYGTRILRVTDGNILANAQNTVFLTPAGSFVHNWNADSSMFWLYGNGHAVPFRFDANTMQATRVPKPGDPSGGLALPFAGPFSYRQPNILYGGVGVQIVEYDFNTDKTTVVFDAAQVVPGAGGAYLPSVSDDDSKLALAFGGMQDEYTHIAVLDRHSGHYSVMDTKNSTVNGKPASIPLGWGVHSAYLDRTGRYVIIGKGLGSHGNSDWAVWDTTTDQVYEILAHWSGHDASGFGVRVNESGFCCAIYEQNEYSIRSLDSAGINQPKYLVAEQDLPTPHLLIESGHFSWNNARPNALAPIVGTHYRDVSTASQQWRAWDDEIIAVATDGSGKVWRFAHHFSQFDGNFWDSPRGNVSQDGRWFVFTSNWGKTVGKDPSGATRQDVFLCELPAATTVAGGSNLLQDPGFENGGQGWQGAAANLIGQPGHSGNAALTLTASPGVNPTIYQEVAATPGATYDVSGWVNASGANPGGFGIILGWVDASGQVFQRDMVGAASPGGWKQLSRQLVAPAGTVKLRVRLYGEPGAGVGWFDDLTATQQ